MILATGIARKYRMHNRLHAALVEYLVGERS